jgi:uncharacterized protein (DUF4213/DUF364 family)
MEILKSIMSSIEEDAPVSEVRRGLHWTAVVSRHCGLASTIAHGGCTHGAGGGMEGNFTKMTALEIARLCLDNDPAKATLGLAAINSLINVDHDIHQGMDGLNIIKELAGGKNISVIGHFPYLDELAENAKNLWIIEKQPMPGDHTEDAGNELIPQSDIVVITSTTLINKTLPGILELCKEGSVKMLLGPSTPLSPVLFDYGIDILSGSIVTENNVVLRSVSEGASFMQLKRNGGVRFVNIINDYDDILRRLAD